MSLNSKLVMILFCCPSSLFGCTRAPNNAIENTIKARFTIEQQGAESLTLKAEGAYFKFVNRQENIVRYHAQPQVAISPSGLWAAAKDKRLALEPNIVINNTLQTSFHVCQDGFVYIRDANGKQSKIGRLLLYSFEHPEQLHADTDGFIEAKTEAGAEIQLIPDSETQGCQS